MVEKGLDDQEGQQASDGESALAPAPIELLLEQLVERASEVIGVQDRLRRLLRANRAVVAELSLAGVLRRIVEAARELARAEYAALGVIASDGSLEQFIHLGMDESTVAAIGELPKGRGLLGALIVDPEPIRLVSIGDDDRSSGFPPHHPPMQSFLGVPIRSRNQVYGNLYLANQVDGAFTLEDQELVLALAATAGIAIENARLYEESQRRQAWLRASADIGAVLLTPQRQDPLELIIESMKRLAGADAAMVVRHADEPGMLQVETAIGVGADGLRGLRYPAENSLVELALTTGHGARADSPGTSEIYVDGLSQALDVGAVMAVPLGGHTGPRVALGLARAKGRPNFEPADLEMAEAFAQHAAVAIELMEARANQQRLAVLEDRDRIARDLHDHVIQRLFAAGLSVQSLASAVGLPEHAQRLGRVVDDLDETIRQIRSSIFELQNPPTVPQGVRSTVLAVAEQLTPLLGFEPTVNFVGPVDTLVGGAMIADVEAVVREGMTNVAKHAQATSLEVTVLADARLLSVTIRDNGIGIGDPGRHSGLRNLHARAEKHKGALAVQLGETGGTELRWTARLSS